MKRIAYLAPLGIFLGISVGFAVGLSNDPKNLPSMLIDQSLPGFDLPPLPKSTQGFASSDLGGQVALVNIFASWCGGCRVEHPVLLELASSNVVPLYGINWKDKARDGAAWLEQFGNPYKATGSDASGRLGIDLGITGVPETYVIDRTGRVRFRQIGPITPEVWRDTLEPLVAQLKSEG